MRASVMRVLLPVGAPAPAPTTAGAASTAAVALPSGALRVWISGTEGFALIAGGAGVDAAAVATCMPFQPDADYIFDVPAGVTHFRAIRTGSIDAVITVAAVS